MDVLIRKKKVYYQNDIDFKHTSMNRKYELILSLHWNVVRHTHIQSGLWYANIIRDRKETKHENNYGTENAEKTKKNTYIIQILFYFSYKIGMKHDMTC